MTSPARRVVYDARYAAGRPHGIGAVCLELLRGFAEHGGGPRIAALVSPGMALPAEVTRASDIELVEVSRSPYGLANQLLLPGLLRRLGAGVYHGVDCFNPVLAGRVRTIVTVHDLIPLVHADFVPRSWKARLRPAWNAWLAWQCRRADAVVTVSRHSAADLTGKLGVPNGKIRVIPNPLRRLHPAESREEFRRRLGLTDCSVLVFVGRPDPYKNLLGLLRALPEVVARLGPSVRLLVVGRPDQRYPEPLREIDRLGLTGQVMLFDYLDGVELASLYAASDALVFPSLYEGFGLPPLEAMSLGTPVVASNRAAMPEVLGDAALYADPEDPAELVSGIVRILAEPGLADRLREAGLARAAAFTSRRAAEEHLALYAEMLAGEVLGLSGGGPAR